MNELIILQSDFSFENFPLAITTLLIIIAGLIIVLLILNLVKVSNMEKKVNESGVKIDLGEKEKLLKDVSHKVQYIIKDIITKSDSAPEIVGELQKLSNSVNQLLSNYNQLLNSEMDLDTQNNYALEEYIIHLLKNDNMASMRADIMLNKIHELYPDLALQNFSFILQKLENDNRLLLSDDNLSPDTIITLLHNK